MTNEQLCALAKQGNIDAQNLLVENNLHFIQKTAYEVWSAQKELNCALILSLMIWCRKALCGFTAALSIINPTAAICF